VTFAPYPSPDLVLHSARIVTGGENVDDGYVAFTGGMISATGTGDSWRGLEPVDSIDAAGAILVPGFIDIHGHGGGGCSFDSDADGIRTALAVHRAHGTTRSVLSLVTGSIDDLVERVALVAGLAENDETILGSHLEGPFLDVGHKGAHDPDFLCNPDPAVIDRLLEAARGTIRQVTLAPELPGGMDAIRQFTAAGVAVAVGHTDTDFDGARSAFEAGASILTHAFNAMNGIHHRNPGPVAAAAAFPSVTLEIINDGVHVHPDVVRIAFAAAPGRVALVTDAMAAAGSTDGTYRLGSLSVDVVDGVARLAGGGSIAGSTLTQDAALRRAVTEVGIPLPEAVAALTEVPARAVGRAERLGRLEAGFAADAVLLDDSYSVTAVWAAGVRVR
jgi:N-acetylglucosamine-6-phosphate deacetylase